MLPKDESKGRLIGVALSGAWRGDPRPLEISASLLAEIAPPLLKSGAAALCWRRVRQSGLRTSPAAAQLQQAYRFQTLQARIDQRKIERAFNLLRSVQIEPVLVKGWAVARLYPEQGLRPYADVDLCVRDEDYAKAAAMLKTPAGRRPFTDLHKGFDTLGGGNFDDLYARSRLERLGETDVRMLGPEDHLRVLCFHMLREGAWRPLWLCDVAVALEVRPASFDWERCLSGARRSREVVPCAVGLAHRLLGADVRGTPFAAGADGPPAWAVRTVLREWGAPEPSMARRHKAPMDTYVRHAGDIFEGLRNRWPNPVEATTVVGGPFNNLPRLPFQIASYLVRASGLLRRRRES